LDNWLFKQTKPIQTQFKAKQTQFEERPKMTQSLYLQAIMKKMRLWAIKKQTQNKPNSKPISKNLWAFGFKTIQCG
jgi:hypothetical protein